MVVFRQLLMFASGDSAISDSLQLVIGCVAVSIGVRSIDEWMLGFVDLNFRLTMCTQTLRALRQAYEG